MHKALHPYKNIKISVSEHIREYGNEALLLEERARYRNRDANPGLLNRARTKP